MTANRSSGSGVGRVLSILLILSLIATALYVFKRSGDSSSPHSGDQDDSGETVSLEGLTETQRSVPALTPPGPYVPKDNIVDLDISEYAGYAGLLLANNGLEPTENSVFFRNHGFKVRITVSEENNWGALNSGKFAGSATTTDVLAVYGRQWQVVCPLLIGYSRGADGIVVRSDIRNLNSLTGKVTVAAQFDESDFFLRYLAQEAGTGVHMLDSIDDPPVPDRINLVYAEDAFVAADVFMADLKAGGSRIAACATWAPKTTQSVAESGGKARLLVTNRNVLIVSDILLLNRGFAQANPSMVSGLVDGILQGNSRIRRDPSAADAVLKAAYGWEPAQCREELAKIHFANLPENEAYFSGVIDMAGSFGGIYQSAVVAYGRDLLPDPAGYEKFIELSGLKAARDGGRFDDEQIEIAPIPTRVAGAVEADPLLSKDIRFFFEPNSSTFVEDNEANSRGLEDIRRLIRISPGSILRLRGHVDDAKKAEFAKEGEATLRRMALHAMKLSQDRANEVRSQLIQRFQVDPARIETVGRGWEEPAGPDSDLNRRVEVQWFTLE